MATILSGQGTPSVTVEWNFPVNCPNCPSSTFDYYADVSDPNTWCNDWHQRNQPLGWTQEVGDILGADSPHAGDTSWYASTYFEGLNSLPFAGFTNLVGGTIINSFTNLFMGNGISYPIQNYIQVVWGAPGTGLVTFSISDGAGGCTDTLGIPITIGPAGNIDPKIKGPEYVCLNDTADFYAEAHAGSTYDWDAPGGYIIAGQGTDHIQVSYEYPYYSSFTEQASLMLTEVNNGRSASTHHQVTHGVSAAYPPVLYGPTSVCNNASTRYYVSMQTETTQWTVSGGAIVSGQGTDTIVVQWPFFGSGTGSVSVVANSGPVSNCSLNRSLSVNYGGGVATYPQLIAPSSATMGNTVTYSTPLNAGHTYTWTVSSGGSLLSGQGTNSIQVLWTQAGPQTVTIIENGLSCGTNTQTANINVNSSMIVEVSSNDSTLQTGYGPQQCAMLSATTSPVATNPSYLWSTGATTPTITVCPTTYSLTVTDPILGTATDDIVIQVEDLSCGNGGVTICRNLGLFTFTQCVQPLLVPTYLSQGATLGACPSKMAPQLERRFAFEIMPNPAKEQAEVLLAVSDAGQYEVELLDMQGRVLKTLFSGRMEEGEMREVQIARGSLSSGMYLVVLRGPGIRELKKWSLL